MNSRTTLRCTMLAVAAVQVWLAHRYFGFLTGDDVEVLAEAFRWARGFEYQPWDIRNLFVPDFIVAPVVLLATKLGFSDTRHLIAIATLPFTAAGVLSVWLVYRLALRVSADQVAATAAMLLFAFHWLPLGFGSTVYPRNIAMCCVLAAALIADRHAFIAGLLAGLAFADRFSEIAFLVPLIVVAAFGWLRNVQSDEDRKEERRAQSAERGESAARSRVRNVLLALAGAALSISLTVGVYDWITWGAPFSSFLKFARLTLVEPDFASRVKYQAPWWYLTSMPRWIALTLLPFLWMARRQRIWWFVLVPLVAFSAVKHKELRYLQVVVPFVMIAAGIGAAELWRTHRKLTFALLAVSVAWQLAGLRYFTRKSQPAVRAAQLLAADPTVGTVTMSQLWAYGDRLYFTARVAPRDVGTPPRELPAALPGSDAVALWESDLDRSVLSLLAAHGFRKTQTFDDGEARAVVVFRLSPVVSH